jgi:hypothetical protein
LFNLSWLSYSNAVKLNVFFIITYTSLVGFKYSNRNNILFHMKRPKLLIGSNSSKCFNMQMIKQFPHSPHRGLLISFCATKRAEKVDTQVFLWQGPVRVIIWHLVLPNESQHLND